MILGLYRRIVVMSSVALSILAASTKQALAQTVSNSSVGGSEGAYYLRQSGTESRIAEFGIDFRWDKSYLDLNYMQTGERLKELSDSIASIGIGKIDSIRVVSYSSPEGKYLYNLNLSRRRAASTANYLIKTYPSLQKLIFTTPAGESWHLLRSEIENDKSLSPKVREQALKIIDSDITEEAKKVALKNASPALWNKIMRGGWLVRMRHTYIDLHYNVPVFERVGTVAEIIPAFNKGAETDNQIGMPGRCFESKTKHTLFALKTNLLYDIVTALNAEIEVPVGKRWSVMWEDVFPWWNWGPNGNKYALQMWEMGIEPRYWFARTCKRDKLDGHFVGLYGMSSRYDFQYDTDACYQGEYWSVGLTYGYAMPIGKVFNLEFSVSAGYLNTDYRHYQPGEEYEALYRDPTKVGTLSYWGPTKLKISLVLPITYTKTRRYCR